MIKINRKMKKIAAAVLAASLLTASVLPETISLDATATETETTDEETAEETTEETSEDPEVTEGGAVTEEEETTDETAEEETTDDLAEEAAEETGEEYPTPTEWPAMVDMDTPAAIIMDADTGAILYSKDAETAYYPASITKIMTALVVLENAQLDDIVTFSETAVYENEGNTSHIARDIGEQMTMEQTLYGMMLESANECAWALAEHVGGGDVNVFVDMMNAKAEELGCTNTHFANPNGLHDDNHYTCAADMAKIAQAAWELEEFRTITGTRNYTIPPTNKHTDETILNNHHQMLNYYKTNDYLYDGCVGGKTGFTTEARYTLVTYCEKDGQTLISVVMHTEYPTEYVDTTTLMNYGFDNFYNTSTETASDEFISAAAASMNKIDAKGVTVGTGYATLPNGLSLSDCDTELDVYDTDDLEKDDDGNYIVGLVNFSWQGNTLGNVQIISTSKPSGAAATSDETVSDTEESSESSGLSVMQIALIVIGVLIGILVIIYIIALIRKYQRKKRRQEQMRQRRLEEQRRREQEEAEQRNRRRNTRYRTSGRSGSQNTTRTDRNSGNNTRRNTNTRSQNSRSDENRRPRR